MNKKRVYIALFALILLSLFATLVHAQLLDPILRPLQGIDIVGTYNRYGFVVDTILIFVILVGAAQVGLGERFKDQKSIVVAVGIALSIAAAIGLWKTGFRLGSLWPLAMIMVFLVLGFMAYNYFKRVSGVQNRGYAMLAFAFLFFYLQALPGTSTLINEFKNSPSPYVRLIWALLNLIAVVCLIWGIVELVKGIARWGGGTGAGRGGAGAGGGGTGAGGGGPSWWQRMFGPPKEGADLDYTKSGSVIVKVTDINGQPIPGSEVVITGAKLKYRLPVVGTEYKQWTNEQGIAVFDKNIPVGFLKVRAEHPGYKFWSCKLGTAARTRETNFHLREGETVNIVIQLKREEERGGTISGRVVDFEQARNKGVDQKADGKTINTKFNTVKDNIGLASEPVFLLARSNQNPSGFGFVPGHQTQTDGLGFFEIIGVPHSNELFVGILNENVSEINNPNTWIHPDTWITQIGGRFGGVYGRGGQKGKNPPPPKAIKISTIHRKEENVVICAKKENGRTGPEVPVDGIVQGGVIDEDEVKEIGNQKRVNEAVASGDPKKLRNVIRALRPGCFVKEAKVWAVGANGKKVGEETKSREKPFIGYFEMMLPPGDYFIKAEKDKKKGRNDKTMHGLPKKAIRVETGRAYDSVVPIRDVTKIKEEIKEMEEEIKNAQEKFKEQKKYIEEGVKKPEEMIGYINNILEHKFEGKEAKLKLEDIKKTVEKAQKMYGPMSEEVKEELRKEGFNPEFAKHLRLFEDETAYRNLEEGVKAIKKEGVFYEHEEGKHTVITKDIDKEDILKQINKAYFLAIGAGVSEFWRNSELIFKKQKELLEKQIQ